MIGLGGASVVLATTVVRKVTVGVRAVRRAERLAKRLAERPAGVAVSGQVAVLIPVKGEPDQAEASARWWAEQDVADVWFVTSECERPSMTYRRLSGLPGTRVLHVSSPNKAGQLNDALACLPDHVTAVAVFDSDSRPVGVIGLGSRSHVTVGPVLYRTNFSAPHSAFGEGLALSQTVWSLGFETDMGMRRRLWYTVGHGLVLYENVISGTTFDETLLTEDLGLGYRLSRGRSTEEGSFVDVSLFFSSPGPFVEGIGRWFTGDLQAVLRQDRSPVVAVRALELVATWFLGPPLVLAAIARLAREDTRLGLACATIVVAAVVGPAELVRREVWPQLGIEGGFGRAVVAGMGVLARPALDVVACAAGIRRYLAGTSVHQTASRKPAPPVASRLNIDG
jgi:hypothetical protein